MSESFIPVSKVRDLPEGSMIGVEALGRRILLSLMGGKFYALDAICTHQGGYLDKGQLTENVVTCPVHKAEFDVKTGRMIIGPPISRGASRELRSYEVQVVGEDICVKVGQP